MANIQPILEKAVDAKATNAREAFDRKKARLQADRTKDTEMRLAEDKKLRAAARESRLNVEKNKLDFLQNLEVNYKATFEAEYRAEIREKVYRDRGRIEDEYEQQIREDARSRLEDDLEPLVKAELGVQLEPEVRQTLQAELEDVVKDELRVQLAPDVKELLKLEMSPTIRLELRDELYEDVLSELRHELAPTIQREMRISSSIVLNNSYHASSNGEHDYKAQEVEDEDDVFEIAQEDWEAEVKKNQHSQVSHEDNDASQDVSPNVLNRNGLDSDLFPADPNSSVEEIKPEKVEESSYVLLNASDRNAPDSDNLFVTGPTSDIGEIKIEKDDESPHVLSDFLIRNAPDSNNPFVTDPTSDVDEIESMKDSGPRREDQIHESADGDNDHELKEEENEEEDNEEEYAGYGLNFAPIAPIAPIAQMQPTDSEDAYVYGQGRGSDFMRERIAEHVGNDIYDYEGFADEDEEDEEEESGDNIDSNDGSLDTRGTKRSRSPDDETEYESRPIKHPRHDMNESRGAGNNHTGPVNESIEASSPHRWGTKRSMTPEDLDDDENGSPSVKHHRANAYDVQGDHHYDESSNLGITDNNSGSDDEFSEDEYTDEEYDEEEGYVHGGQQGQGVISLTNTRDTAFVVEDSDNDESTLVEDPNLMSKKEPGRFDDDESDPERNYP